MEKHDLLDGYQSHCQICGYEQLQLVVDLGTQPLADKLTNIDCELSSEVSYPLIQVWCPICALSQLNYICPSHIMFGDDYNYKTGVTKELVTYQYAMASELVSDLNLSKQDVVCDIGSNDGTLLKGFLKKGVKVIGIEPTDIADLANKDGVRTLRKPFGEDAAKAVVAQTGKVTLATATNVFAHVQRLGDFIRGLDIILNDNGWFCLENHYLVEILESFQYDTIYHEHLRSLSVSSVVKLFSQYRFSVVKVEQTSRYGGNIRVLVRKGEHESIDESVQYFIEREKKLGLFQPEVYIKFREKTISQKMDLLEMLIELRKKGKSVVGYSLPARAVTLINYVGIDHDLLPYIVEQPASLKLNKFVPGTRIRVISNECLEEKNPDYLLVFAWHLKDEIITYLRGRGLKGICIIPLPEVSLVEL